jgi:hypothetical protein
MTDGNSNITAFYGDIDIYCREIHNVCNNVVE